MSFDNTAVRKHLQSFDIKGLFTQELGWDRHSHNLTVTIGGQSYQLEGVAHKRDIVAFVCAPDAEGRIPPYRLRRKIEAQVTKAAYEHIIIYTDRHQEQVWQWMRREKGKSTVPREVPYYADTSGDLLIQKLRGIKVELDEEDALTLTVQTERNRRAFNVETVTQNFYRGFKIEHAQFVAAIEPKTLPDADREWYTSVMLNRLMFLYFIQRKEFLDGDDFYLQNRLRRVQKEQGRDQFFTFYRHFLMRLFHEGLGQSTHSPELQQLIGKVPYLNGGLFAEHAIERRCREQGIEIHIPDTVFASVFAFFQNFDWHLDNRKHKQGDEINPDVLGYIFEKYINFNEAGQKENGAYYTKEDITEYISRSTTLPHLLDTAKAEYRSAFEGRNSVWTLLRDSPADYIFPAVKHGSDLPLPPHIEAGIADVSKRGDWNRPAPATHALPTEIWREVVARRLRCAEICTKLAQGEITSANDLITYNLDIQQFVTDCITDYDDPQLLRALWHAIKNVRVLDPTVGSGAFLFAALNILEPLYERCLERMEAYVGDKVREAGMTWAGEFAFVNEVTAQQAFVEEEEREADYAREFQAELAYVNAPEHPNRPYFIFKSIIVNNLFGVDIMEEATEICKLRLFLKLVAQVEPDMTKRNMEVGPLPDVDFNIRAGNTLVGYVNEADMERLWTATGQLQMERDPELTDKVREYSHLLANFQRQQLDASLKKTVTKEQVERAARIIRDGATPDKPGNAKSNPSLNNDLWNLYKTAGKLAKNVSQAAFNDTHTPLHWFVEFPEVMANGGFDVIIGNPPYVEYRFIKTDYDLLSIAYKSLPSDNTYAFCMERAISLTSKSGRFGMIVPSGVLGLDDSVELRNVLTEAFSTCFCSTYAIRPAKLFEGVDQRLCIFIATKSGDDKKLYTTRYTHWNAEERSHLFATLTFSATQQNWLRRIPQVGSKEASGVLQKIEAKSSVKIGDCFTRNDCALIMHYHRSPRYWIRAIDFEQYFKSPTKTKSVHHVRDLCFSDPEIGKSIGALMNSSLFFFWFISLGNGRNITGVDVSQFPVGNFTHEALIQLGNTFDELMIDYQANSFVRVRQDCEFQEFKVSKSKRIMDEIDRVLAKHYDFKDSELDFIINYDIKYRLGRGGDDENE